MRIAESWLEAERQLKPPTAVAVLEISGFPPHPAFVAITAPFD
jgi:hypothetical protein